jgi:hypothetical protein
LLAHRAHFLPSLPAYCCYTVFLCGPREEDEVALQLSLSEQRTPMLA